MVLGHSCAAGVDRHYRAGGDVPLQSEGRDAELRAAVAEAGANVAWWLRLKGIRDIVSGLVLLALVVWGAPRLIGIVMLIQALIPVGDMTLILVSKGSTKTAFGDHGLTAALMILGAVPLILGAA